MHDLLTTYLEPILTFIAGGGIVSIVKWRSIKRQAEAEAMMAIQDLYQESIRDLREDKDLLKNSNIELREQVGELQKQVFQNSQDIMSLKRFKCVVLDCKLRKMD